MDVALVGAGRVGTALAVLLAKAGHRVVAASGGAPSKARVERFLPGVPFLPASQAASAGDVVVLGVPDDNIASTCSDLASSGAFRSRQAVAHLSGSEPLLALGPARAAEALVLSMHPLQTFPDVEAGMERFPGSYVAVTAWEEEAYATGERLASDAGGRPFRLPEEHKPLYHAAAVFCSNYLTTVEGIAERLFRAAGLAEPVPMFAPLAMATLDNVVRLGPVASLTGPVARGDAGTVRRNLEALSSHAAKMVPAYVVLARAALDLAEEDGRIGKAQRAEMEEVLGEWS